MRREGERGGTKRARFRCCLVFAGSAASRGPVCRPTSSRRYQVLGTTTSEERRPVAQALACPLVEALLHLSAVRPPNQTLEMHHFDAVLTCISPLLFLSHPRTPFIRVTVALQHPLLREGGLLSPLVASLAQWHLIDDPEQGLGLALTEAIKATLREADGLKRALGQVSHSMPSLFVAT